MASRSFASLAGGGRSTLDVPVAALAGLAVAVIAFAAPADLLGNLVGATGLPSVLAAAEPPLGFKARIGIGAVGAIAVFAFTFLLLRWLERSGRRRSPVEEEEVLELEIEAPRLRRRDIHPDAPARAPLLAAHELGEPDFEAEESFVDARAAWPSPEAAPAPPPAPEPAWEAPAEPSPPVESSAWPNAAEAEPAPANEEVDQAGAYALSQNRWSEPAEPEPAPVEPHSWNGAAAEPEPARTEPEPAPYESPLPLVHEPEQAAEAPNPWSPEPQAPPAANEDSLAPPAPGSIAELMERLERGLARRRIAPEPLAEAVAEVVEPVAAPPADDRLQNAINSLQRFASRQD
jgi:hypothetical protein